MSTLTIRDTTLSGETLNEWSLDFLTEKVTVRELIRSRVYQEVQDYNLKQPERFLGLIQPAAEESRLNGPRTARPKQIDWKRQFDRALDAFRKKQVLILLEDHQLEDLDEEIEIKAGAEVSFLRLTMLTGG
ncbi:MAG: hypothetical protein AB7K24_28625 [Gemmataceae bacterium]